MPLCLRRIRYSRVRALCPLNRSAITRRAAATSRSRRSRRRTGTPTSRWSRRTSTGCTAAPASRPRSSSRCLCPSSPLTSPLLSPLLSSLLSTLLSSLVPSQVHGRCGLYKCVSAGCRYAKTESIAGVTLDLVPTAPAATAPAPADAAASAATAAPFSTAPSDATAAGPSSSSAAAAAASSVEAVAAVAEGAGPATVVGELPRCPACGAPSLPQALLFDEDYESHSFYQQRAACAEEGRSAHSAPLLAYVFGRMCVHAGLPRFRSHPILPCAPPGTARRGGGSAARRRSSSSAPPSPSASPSTPCRWRSRASCRSSRSICSTSTPPSTPRATRAATAAAAAVVAAVAALPACRARWCTTSSASRR